MKSKGIDSIKLGLFVLAGVLFLVVTLYMIGKNRNLLGKTITITAALTNVNGLMPGNNVRFKGIDVGTVKKLVVHDDTTIHVIMVIDKAMQPYIKENAMVAIGTDGLMGNRLVNISSMPGNARVVGEGSVLRSMPPIETDEMLRTLNTTNITIERVTRNLDQITVKLNSSNSLWNLLSDTMITKDLKLAVRDFRIAGANTAKLTQSAGRVVSRFDEGHGLAKALFTDSTLVERLDYSLRQIQEASAKTAYVMESMESVIGRIQGGYGTAGLLLEDSTMREALMKSAIEIEHGTTRFNENMEAMRSNFLFRRYFRKAARKNSDEADVTKNR